MFFEVNISWEETNEINNETNNKIFRSIFKNNCCSTYHFSSLAYKLKMVF